MLTTQKKQVILATRNPGKVSEIKQKLSGFDFDIITLDSFPDIPEVLEDGATIEENAEKKARVIYAATGIMTLADDTALEVDFLNGEPGVYSSRFAGEDATYEMNNNKLLQLLKGVSLENRKAKFRCVMAIVNGGKIELLEGTCSGYILEEKRGQAGFGYDPLFYIPSYQKTFAEMSLSLKNKISHRGKVLQKVRKYFENIT